MATLFSGVPSTLFFIITGVDLWPPIQAVGEMVLPSSSEPSQIFIAAALVHGTVSVFWTLVVARILPVKHAPAYAIAASALIAVIDLRVIAPVFFPAVAALSFWPQVADHLAWGLLLGVTLEWSAKARARRRGAEPAN
ncbi:MAG: hypothetical protein JWN94_4065 [Betaproteobacteria bacterium]|nr:hypothetical protein [Betaproteobacteria bacterium]